MPIVSFTDNDAKPWAPYAPVLQHVTASCAGAKRILDIGAGKSPFPPATHVADLFPVKLPNVTSVQVNFRKRELPYEDKFFDFVYCRHTFEDLDDPSRLMAEIQRVGRRGYVETPSPLSEVCRGIDGGSPTWRGYSHHRHMIWSAPGCLFVLPKLAQIEYISLPDADHISALKAEPGLANSYLLWEGSFQSHFVWDRVLMAYEAGQRVPSYEELVRDAVSQGMTASRSMLEIARPG